MINYTKLAKEMAKNLLGMTDRERVELFNDKDYAREHLVPKDYEQSDECRSYLFELWQLYWFNNFETDSDDIEWTDEDEFDFRKMEKALLKYGKGKIQMEHPDDDCIILYLEPDCFKEFEK